MSLSTGQGGPLISFVSASGGVGKSTLALMAAWRAASAGVSVALVEADLQFGDIGYWLGFDDEAPSLAAGAACEPIHLASKLVLYKAPPLPELAEDVAEGVARLALGIRRAYDLVIADTGQFWSGITAELVVNAGIVVNVMDIRPTSVMGAVRAMELCSRMGVPATRIVSVYNRYSSRARLAPGQVAAALHSKELVCVGEGRSVVDASLCAGALEELASSGSALVAGVDDMLTCVLPRVGVAFAAPKHARRRGRF